MRAVVEDYRKAPISDAEMALLRFLEKVNREAWRVAPSDVEQVRAAGWSTEALYDAITVCALFNFYNRWCDGTGVRHLPPHGYALAGKRLASIGYAASLPPKRKVQRPRSKVQSRKARSH